MCIQAVGRGIIPTDSIPGFYINIYIHIYGEKGIIPQGLYIYYIYTVFPRSLEQFYILSHYIKMVKTSSTNSIYAYIWQGGVSYQQIPYQDFI